MAIEKLREDQMAIESRFEHHMSFRTMKNGLEVLEDFISFFECSPAFMSVPTEKLRRTQGKMFNFKICNSLMNLRTDLTSVEKGEALRICKDIIDNYREDLVQKDPKKPAAKSILS
jgi:hypothetical protein